MYVTGNTPLIPIGNGLIWAKLETHNRTGSVKDRMINYIMNVALQYKNVKPGVTTIVEATSGNTHAVFKSVKCRLSLQYHSS
jgi:cysteine synthase